MTDSAMENEPNVFDAWVTKYALSQGINKITARVCYTTSVNMIEEIGTKYPTYYHGEGNQWHRTEAGALTQAECMRAAKIQSLQRQIKRLEKLQFGPPKGECDD